MILETTFETGEGAVTVDRLHAARATASRTSSARWLDSRGSVAMKTQIILRFGYGSIVPWVSRLPTTERFARSPAPT